MGFSFSSTPKPGLLAASSIFVLVTMAVSLRARVFTKRGRAFEWTAPITEKCDSTQRVPARRSTTRGTTFVG